MWLNPAAVSDTYNAHVSLLPFLIQPWGPGIFRRTQLLRLATHPILGHPCVQAFRSKFFSLSQLAKYQGKMMISFIEFNGSTVLWGQDIWIFLKYLPQSYLLITKGKEWINLTDVTLTKCSRSASPIIRHINILCPSYDEQGRALLPSSGILDHKYLTSVYARVNHQTNSSSGSFYEIINTLQKCQVRGRQRKTEELSQIRGDKETMTTSKHNVESRQDPRPEKKDIVGRWWDANKVCR